MKKQFQIGIFITIFIISTTVCCQTSTERPRTQVNVNVNVNQKKHSLAEKLEDIKDYEKLVDSINNSSNITKIIEVLRATTTEESVAETTEESIDIQNDTTEPAEIVQAHAWAAKTTARTTLKPKYVPGDVAFFKLGTYRGFNSTNEYQKSYFIPRIFRVNWITAHMVCKSYDMELATFETLEEFTNFQYLWQSSPETKNFSRELYLSVDGMTKLPKSKDGWYNTKNGKKIPFEMQWMRGQPNFSNNLEFCLAIGRVEVGDLLKFNDVMCLAHVSTMDLLSPWGFVCQKNEFVV